MNDERKKSGFTLIEVLLVVAIIGMLAAVGIARLPGRLLEAKINATRAKIGIVATAIDVYEVDMGQYPGSMQDLIANPGGDNWHGPYVKGGLPTDPWGTALQYVKVSNLDYKVVSGGPDKQVGSEDDIKSFEASAQQ